jgi:hypothetical protein
VEKRMAVKFAKLKIIEAATPYWDYFLPEDVRRIKERSGIVYILVSDPSTNHLAWVELDSTEHPSEEDVCYTLDICLCNGVEENGG